MAENEITIYEPIDKEKVKAQIFEIRGYRVMIDSDIAMLTSALHTDRAIEASIQIMEAFVEMSHYIRQNRQLLPYDELKALELKHYQLSDKVQNIEDNRKSIRRRRKALSWKRYTRRSEISEL